MDGQPPLSTINPAALNHLQNQAAGDADQLGNADGDHELLPLMQGAAVSAVDVSETHLVAASCDAMVRVYTFDDSQ